MIHFYTGYQKFLQSSFLRGDNKLKYIYFNCGSTGRAYLHLIAKNVNPRIVDQFVLRLGTDLVEENNKVQLENEKGDQQLV